MRHIRGLLEFGGDALGRVAGILAAMLPARWWPSLDRYIPVTDSALIAAIMTMLVAGGIGIPGFLAHTQALISGNNAVIIEAAERPNADPDPKKWGRAFLMSGSLALFTFIFTTPAGWASTYLGISGSWRAMGCIVDHPFGDPILTGLDAALLRSARRRRVNRARRHRESLEGPEIPDRVVSAKQVGIDGAELVIVSSRVKPQWDKGTVVMTGEEQYRVVAIEERTIAGRLRTLYALSAHRDLEAFRRTVQYTLPRRADEDEARQRRQD